MSDQTPPQPGTPPQPLTDAETRQWAGLAHLGGILGFLPALIIWLMYKDRSAFVADQSRKALNFQITLVIAYVAINVLGFIVPGLGFLVLAVWVASIIFSVIGYQTVNRGQGYSYPFSLELVK